MNNPQKPWLIASIAATALAATWGCSREVSYQADIYPIIKQHCLECHDSKGEGYEKSGLNMESYDTLMKGTKFGPVIVSGSSISSTLVRLIQGKADKSIQMPHHREPLPDDQIDTIVRWIDEGAKNN